MHASRSLRRSAQGPWAALSSGTLSGSSSDSSFSVPGYGSSPRRCLVVKRNIHDLADGELGCVQPGEYLGEADGAGRLQVPSVRRPVEAGELGQVLDNNLAPRYRLLGTVGVTVLYRSTPSRGASTAHLRPSVPSSAPDQRASNCVRWSGCEAVPFWASASVHGRFQTSVSMSSDVNWMRKSGLMLDSSKRCRQRRYRRRASFRHLVGTCGLEFPRPGCLVDGNVMSDR